ncbi:MAG: single-stranded DNA-binding protein [Phycisphaerales bacterium]|nr:single-stranded DNA-binding protein [Phycisphaerales bacterium]
MPNVNKVFLMGNLTRDPQVSYLPSQTAVCEIGLAINRNWTAQDGQKKEEVTFVDCSAFGKTAETIGKYLKKGRPIFIEGRLKYDTWEDKEGKKRSRLRVVIDQFQFVDSRPGGSGGSEGGEGGGEGGGQAYRPAARPIGRPAAGNDAPPADDGPPPINESDIPF